MKKVSPYVVIALSFLSIIVIGTILLWLPISQQEEGSLSFVNALFISTSAVTITGLSPVTSLAATLSIFGKIVLAILIQIGGLSVVTLSVFIMYLIGAKIGITNRILIKESFNQNSLSGMVKLVIRIVVFTLIIESTGFIFNLFVFLKDYEVIDAIGISAFHAIAAFNNSGFDIIGSSNLIGYNGNVMLNMNTTLLIMIGGIGFVVINDIIEKKSYKKLMIHSKIVLIMNAILWVSGTLMFKVSQIHSMQKYTWLEAFFLSVTARTAGFTTINLSTLSALSTLILLILMFIGASPASTGGGVKTTTIYTLFKGASSYARGTQPLTHERLISDETRHKASVLLTTALGIIALSTVSLLTLENISLDLALFETVSAFSNTGLSMSLTPTLRSGSKLLLCLVMFMGRVGPLTIISLLNQKWHKKDLNHIEYIEEKMMIG